MWDRDGGEGEQGRSELICSGIINSPNSEALTEIFSLTKLEKVDDNLFSRQMTNYITASLDPLPRIIDSRPLPHGQALREHFLSHKQKERERERKLTKEPQ